MNSGISNKLDVVIIDPVVDTRQSLAKIVRTLGAIARTFSNAPDALVALAKKPADLVVVELLLPGLDGFEFCQKINTSFSENMPLLCLSSISWGHLDLASVLKTRFNAHLLRKPFKGADFLSALKDILKLETPPTTTESQTEPHVERTVGQDEAERAESLTRQFERHIARVGADTTRRSVRVEHEYCVEFKTLNEFVKEYTQNISVGGLFIRSDVLPNIDDFIDLSLAIPHLNRTINIQARVVHAISPEVAEARGVNPGFGVEFVEISADDRLTLKKLVVDLQEFKEDPLGPNSQPSAALDLDTIWIVLFGLDGEALLRKPSFLHRHCIEVIAFSTLEEAEDFLAVHRVMACVIHERIAEKSSLARILNTLTKNIDPSCVRLVLSDVPTASELVHQGLCHLILSPQASTHTLIEELRTRLAFIQRSGPRIHFKANVSLEQQNGLIDAQAVNISVGGMLVRTKQTLQQGSGLRLTFDLPNHPHISCHGRVVRIQRGAEQRENLIGVAFVDLEKSIQQLLRAYVQSHVNFREFFGWIKKAYFDPAVGLAEKSGKSQRRHRDVFGLGK